MAASSVGRPAMTAFVASLGQKRERLGRTEAPQITITNQHRGFGLYLPNEAVYRSFWARVWQSSIDGATSAIEGLIALPCSIAFTSSVVSS